MVKLYALVSSCQDNSNFEVHRAYSTKEKAKLDLKAFSMTNYRKWEIKTIPLSIDFRVHGTDISLWK